MARAGPIHARRLLARRQRHAEVRQRTLALFDVIERYYPLF